MIPHPAWTPGQKQPPPDPDAEIIHVDPANTDVGALYALTISAVIPRPIAFISTTSKDGVGNLSPYSYFNAVSHDPPVLAIGHCWSKGKKKDSLTNILDTKEFVVAIISEWFVESANHTCGAYDPDVDELKLAGLTPAPSLKVTPPSIAESAVNMECKLLHTYDIKNKNEEVTCTVVLGEVLMFRVSEMVATRSPNSGKLIIDPAKLQPMARLGGNTFARVSSLFDIPRPDRDGKYPSDSGYSPSTRDKNIQ